MSEAKAEMLERIRSALRDVPRDETPEMVRVERVYRQSDETPTAERIERFIERVEEYKAVVHRVAAGRLREAVAAACAARGVRRLVVPFDLSSDWLPEGVEFVRDGNLTNEQLDATDGVLTACALGIAQTGTIVLDSGPGQGRRAITLVPDYHLCVIREEQIVGLVPEAVAKLTDVARERGRPLTWISGPSATSDIELNRVEGVHGPRTLEVLVVRG